MATVLDFPSGKVMQQDHIASDTLAGILRDLQQALGTTQHIVLKRERSCWSATFRGFTDPLVPCGVPVPLPFTPRADPGTVADDLLHRFPGSIVTVE